MFALSTFATVRVIEWRPPYRPGEAHVVAGWNAGGFSIVEFPSRDPSPLVPAVSGTASCQV